MGDDYRPYKKYACFHTYSCGAWKGGPYKAGGWVGPGGKNIGGRGATIPASRALQVHKLDFVIFPTMNELNKVKFQFRSMQQFKRSVFQAIILKYDSMT